MHKHMATISRGTSESYVYNSKLGRISDWKRPNCLLLAGHLGAVELGFPLSELCLLPAPVPTDGSQRSPRRAPGSPSCAQPAPKPQAWLKSRSLGRKPPFSCGNVASRQAPPQALRPPRAVPALASRDTETVFPSAPSTGSQSRFLHFHLPMGPALLLGCPTLVTTAMPRLVPVGRSVAPCPSSYFGLCALRTQSSLRSRSHSGHLQGKEPAGH